MTLTLVMLRQAGKHNLRGHYMILTDVRDYLKSRGQAPLRDMALTFGMEQDAMRPLLEQWIAKGKVKKMPQGTTCGGGCSSCAPQTIEMYEWVHK